MIIIKLLDDNDIIDPESYFRPLEFDPQMDDSLHNMDLSGRPINNLKWVKVKYVLGPRWYGRKISEYHAGLTQRHEFVSSDSIIPKSHLLDTTNITPLTGYSNGSNNR